MQDLAGHRTTEREREMLAFAPEGQRRQKAAETLNHIIKLAHVEFGENGLKGARMEYIARQAGVPKQFIYYHFLSREGLYQAVMEDMCLTCTNKLLSPDYDSLSGVKAIRTFCTVMFDLYLEMPYTAPLTLDFNFNGGVLMERHGLSLRVRNKFDELVDRGIAEGIFPKRINKRASFFLAVTMLGAYFNRPSGAYAGLHFENFDEINGWRETVIRAILAMMAAD